MGSKNASALSRRKALALMSATAAAQFVPAFDANAAPLTYNLKPVRLDKGIWMIPGVQEAITRENGGAIANVIIIDSAAGAIVIDTGPSKRFGLALANLVRTLTGKQIARVYLTHFHPDHVFGNQAFAPELIAAPQGVIDGLAQMGNAFADAMYQTTGDWMRGTELVLPKRVVDGGVDDFGDRRLRLLSLRGHTASDLALYEETSGFFFAGDLVFLDRAPTTPNANIEAWRISLATLGAIPHNRLVPGHGPAEPGERGIVQTRDWLVVINDIIRKAFDKGLSITEAIAEPLPAWTNQIALARYEYERSVMHIYPKLEAAHLPRVDEM